MRRYLISTSVIAFTATIFAGASAAVAEPQLKTILELPGESTDLTKIKKKETGGAGINRNGFFSDIFYDTKTGDWYALSDRGPGGGLLSYETRVQKFTVTYNADGSISDYRIVKTIPFRYGSEPFNGLNPSLLNGDSSKLGSSFDPEGLVVGQGGHLFVADEYGPSLYEFTSSGQFIRAFAPPANLVPREADTDINYVDGRPTIVTGRQDNRGYEGLAINKSRTKLYAIMQDPLVNEGTSNDGRRSTNVRIVEYNIATGLSERQFVYQLDTIAQINARDPSATAFSATNQGRSIGASGIYALSNTEFLILERDNRGRGVDEPSGTSPKPLHKRIYKIDITGATDVAGISLAGTNGSTLPDASVITPVSKTLFLDMLTAINGANHWIPEKIEGFAPGPVLPDGKQLYLAGTDNDYSITQTGGQFEVCIATDANGQLTGSTQVAIDAGCPTGYTLIPALLMSFKGQ